MRGLRAARRRLMMRALQPRRSARPRVTVPLLRSSAGMATGITLQRTQTIKVKDLHKRTKKGKHITRLEGPFEFDYGGSLPHVDVAWEQWGDPSLPASRTVYILPSFSNSSHVVRSLNDPSPGWWEGMVGPGLYIDTNRFRVVSASNLGGPFGTTSPISEDPGTGKPYRLNFPQITPSDVARVHHSLMQEVRLTRRWHSAPRACQRGSSWYDQLAHFIINDSATCVLLGRSLGWRVSML